MKLTIYDWFGLVKKIASKPHPEDFEDVIETAKSFFKNHYELEDSTIEEICVTEKDIPLFDSYGNFFCWINRKTWNEYKETK